MQSRGKPRCRSIYAASNCYKKFGHRKFPGLKISQIAEQTSVKEYNEKKMQFSTAHWTFIYDFKNPQHVFKLEKMW